MKKSAKRLNKREAQFIEQYLLDGNATKAAERAGYSKHTANEQGSQLLARLSHLIEPRVAEARAKLRKEIGITRERIIQELGCIGFIKAGDFYDEHGNPIDIPALSKRAQRAIAGFEYVEDYLGVKQKDGTTKAEPRGYLKRYKLSDKIRALALMSELLGFKRDKAVTDDMTLEELVLGSFEVEGDKKP